ISLSPKPGGYQNLDAIRYHRQLLERVASIRGADSAAFSTVSVGSGDDWRDAVSTKEAAADPRAGVMTTAATVSEGFFRTIGVALLSGRNFADTDDEQHPHVAIISLSLAKQLFPAGDAIGRRIRYSFMPEFQELEVIAVAGDARLFDLHDATPP